MAIDFSGTEYENEELEPLVTTSLTREDIKISSNDCPCIS